MPVSLGEVRGHSSTDAWNLKHKVIKAFKYSTKNSCLNYALNARKVDNGLAAQPMAVKQWARIHGFKEPEKNCKRVENPLYDKQGAKNLIYYSEIKIDVDINSCQLQWIIQHDFFPPSSLRL